MPKFGVCIFWERPKDCKLPCPLEIETMVGKEGCAAAGANLVQCYLDHYGNKLKKHGALLVLEEMVHLILENDEI